MQVRFLTRVPTRKGATERNSHIFGCGFTSHSDSMWCDKVLSAPFLVGEMRRLMRRNRNAVFRIRTSKDGRGTVPGSAPATNTIKKEIKMTNNGSWRMAWTTEKMSRTAVHNSGLTARISISPTDPSNIRITLVNAETLDSARWDLEKLTGQAIELWMDGKF